MVQPSGVDGLLRLHAVIDEIQQHFQCDGDDARPARAAHDHRHATILGETGLIETGYANHAPAGEGLSLRIRRGAPATVPIETETVAGGDGFLLEGDSFARMVRLGAAHWNGASEAESVDTVRALEAIALSARSKSWVNLAD